jgi:hypothetical protein
MAKRNMEKPVVAVLSSCDIQALHTSLKSLASAYMMVEYNTIVEQLLYSMFVHSCDACDSTVDLDSGCQQPDTLQH